eukprot:CAMPEP_0197075000 /NCGR_PEP_ID=MMETSP1384-20130603/211387_1 /TAXON_ID=29189 /ORGANISM="Ammonia sp." /LENGTH=438 /DNA_ID=CAMNT_0042513843 /DNA_START=141 /DNA_END=1457 /DNA_ORIENTATION=-
MTVVTADNAMERYKRLEKLGEGTYGLVYKAMDLHTNRYVAIKKIKLDNNEEGIPATTMREISLLTHLKHPNIIEMDGCLYVNSELYLVFEFMSCDLKGYIDNLAPNRYFDRVTLKKLTYFLTEGIRFCHSRRILHRDLKPQNILISDNHQLKIADFGLGREHGLPIGELTHEVVTLWYRPPEILLGKKKYSGACDVWGIACIFAEMATKIPLFPGDSEIDQLFQIYRLLGTPNSAIWPGIEQLPEYKPVGPKWKKKELYKELNGKIDQEGIDLLEKMLIYPPNQRITCKQMLCHSWFDEIREEMVSVFGNKYPHCGSKEYQLNKFQQMKQCNKENSNSNGNKNSKSKQKRSSAGNKKMNQDHIHEDTDYDDEDEDEYEQGSNQQQDDDEDEDQDSEDYDDDDDITANAEEWSAHNHNHRYLRNSQQHNLSQPMEEDQE